MWLDHLLVVGFLLPLDENEPYFGQDLLWLCRGLLWVSQQILLCFMGQVLVKVYLQQFHGHLQVQILIWIITRHNFTCCWILGAFISETTERELRKVLSLWKNFQTSIGFVITYSLGYFIGWRLNCFVMVPITVISSLLLHLLLESPYWLIEKGRHEEALWGNTSLFFISICINKM